MNNREFYEKWGKSEELKVIVNAIVFRGLQLFINDSKEPYIRNSGMNSFFLESFLSGEANPDPADYVRYIECYRDLTRMSDGFIKNVIKKVL